MNEKLKESTSVTIKTIILNLILVTIKVISGVVGKSSAMVADGLHSASDILTSIGVLVGNHIASKPDDDCHNYGHEKAETLVSFLLAIILLLASIKIGFDAFVSIFDLNSIDTPTKLPLIVAIISILINEYQFYITMKVAKKNNSSSLMADAWHHRSDSLSSIAVLIGIAGAIMGIKILEPISSIIVAIIVGKVGVDILKSSMNELMDVSITKEEVDNIINIAIKVPGVIGIVKDELKTRSHSNVIYIDITVIVDEDLSVQEGHTIGHQVEAAIRREIENVKRILVHIEPNCQNGYCLLEK